ncbi:uncharacterized protein LOC142768414 isoform X2 [Rhipicephalus microplus]|uniref:uncharacterized protein LOC142768414 isoform X2 n=1 Tax=Rhipicephalus microplus TaxID=6941 RepID=UPI003F6B388E
MIKKIVNTKVLILFLALMTANYAFRIPTQDEIRNTIGNAVLRQAGADLTRKFMRKLGRTFGRNSGVNSGGPTSGYGGGDMLSVPTGNIGSNFGPPSSRTGGSPLLNAVVEGVKNGLTASFGGTSTGLPGSLYPSGGGLMNSLTQRFGAPTAGASGGGLINAFTQGLGGNNLAPTPGGRGGGFLNSVLSSAGQSFGSSVPGTPGGPTGGHETGFLGHVLRSLGTTSSASNTNSSGAGLVNNMLQKVASGLNHRRTGNNNEGFEIR